jgi:pimeloyl-ACP methyl ester carboxylesterase
MKVLFSLLAVLMGIQFFSLASWGTPSTTVVAPKSFAGLVDINQKKLYVEYTMAQPNKPTVILVNGLTYSTRNWFRVSSGLIKAGYGVVTFDMAGMGLSLLSNPLRTKPIFYNQQASDLKTLLNGLKIKSPYNLVGLSYGGGIIAAFATLYPQDAGNLILINPYTEFLETQKSWIKEQISNTRSLFPYNKASDEELTDYFIRQLVYTTYPLAETSSMENPYKLEGITSMVQGIRMYQPIEEARFLPAKSLHLVISENDQYIPQDIYANYWDAIPMKARASRTFVKYSEHKLPEAFPRFTIQFIQGILDGQPIMFNGDTLYANPITMELTKKK